MEPQERVTTLEQDFRDSLKFGGSLDDSKAIVRHVAEFALYHYKTKTPELTLIPHNYQDIHKTHNLVFNVIYLPVEIKAREYPSKLALARKLNEAGFSVVIGWTWGIAKKYDNWLPGIVLFKTMNALDAKNLWRARNAGHLVAVLDEEALPSNVNDKKAQLFIDPWAAALADFILVQSPDHALSLLKMFPQVNGKFSVTGNPRFAKPQEEPIKDAPEEDFELICSMAGTINNFRGLYTTALSQLTLVGPGEERLRQATEAFHETCCNEIDLLNATIQRIRECVEAGKKVVLRPHPIEGPSLWPTILADLFKITPDVMENVTIRTDGTAPAWMRLANCAHVVNTSGSAIDAFKNARIVNYIGEGKEHPKMPNEIPTSISKVVAVLNYLYTMNKMQRDISHVHLTNRKSHFSPAPFHLAKFPPTECPDGAIELEQNIFLFPSKDHMT